MERRLAAILAADVAGYSRLMGADEAGTFARLRAHRQELFEPEIARHMGRAELAKLVDPANYLGVAGEMIDRVLEAYE